MRTDGNRGPNPTPSTPYLSHWEERQGELDQALGLHLHGGERALEDGESLQETAGGVRAGWPPPTPRIPSPHTCWKGLLRLCSQYR